MLYGHGTSTTEMAGFFRRVAALLYDSIILIALFILGTLIILPFNHGKAIATGNHGYQLYLFLLMTGFNLGFWLQGGQTLGMRAWQIKVVTQDNQPISWRQGWLRFILAIIGWLLLGIGFFWMLWDRQKMTLYDRMSKTKIICT